MISLSINVSLVEKKISRISLIKIDTEGFELPVLKGIYNFFQIHKEDLPPIICEITARAYTLLNTDIQELQDFMASFGYRAYSISGTKLLDLRMIKNMENVLFKQ